MAMFCSIAGSLGVPVINGPPPSQQAVGLPVNGQAAVTASALPALVVTSSVTEPVGDPSECLLLKNMFDPNTEVCASLIYFVLYQLRNWIQSNVAVGARFWFGYQRGSARRVLQLRSCETYLCWQVSIIFALFLTSFLFFFWLTLFLAWTLNFITITCSLNGSSHCHSMIVALSKSFILMAHEGLTHEPFKKKCAMISKFIIKLFLVWLLTFKS